MFILVSDIPRELYNQLNIIKDDLNTLTVNSAASNTKFTQYEGTFYIVTNSWDELNNISKDTGVTITTSNSSYFPYPSLEFAIDDR